MRVMQLGNNYTVSWEHSPASCCPTKRYGLLDFPSQCSVHGKQGCLCLCLCGTLTLTPGLENLELLTLALKTQTPAQNQTPTPTLGHTDGVLKDDLRETLHSSNNSVKT